MTENQPIQDLSSSQRSTETDDRHETGIPWLGKIPSHWTVSKVKWQFDVELGKMLDESDISGDDLAPYLRNKDVQWWEINTEDLPQMDFDPAEKRKYELRPGDVLVCEGGEIGRSAIWTDDNKECYYQKALHRVRPLSPDQSPELFCYFMQFAAANGIFTGNTNRSTIDHLTATKLKNQEIPIPPKREQESIAAFLNHRTSRINALISKQERLLDLLDQKRQALIARGVTAGFDSTVATQQAEVEWLDQIPEHWIMSKIKWHYEIQLGKMLDDEQISGEYLAPYLRNKDVDWWEINIRDLPEMDFTPQERRHYELEQGDVLVCEGGEIGRSAVWDYDNVECYYQKALHRVRPRNQSQIPLYFCYFMEYASKGGIFDFQSNQSTISHLTREKLQNQRIPLPPVSEQEQIVSKLDNETGEISEMKENLNRQIDLFQEKRQALITAAVTGQIDVTEERGETHATHR